MTAQRLRESGALILLLTATTVAAQVQPSPSPSPSPTGTEESVTATESTLTRILRTTVTGYVQARATEQDAALPESNLFVRRARLNLRHGFDHGRFALSFDGGQNTVTVKDAYFDVFVTKSRGQQQGLTLRSGQFFRPFGLELERASPDREFPERPVGWGVLFPGNRDQGFDLSLGLTAAATVNVAIVNGGGTSTSTLSFKDADGHKDVMARLRYAIFPLRIDLAASIYRGRQTLAGSPATAAQTGFVDANGNGMRDVGEPAVVVAPAKAAVAGFEADRNRWSLAANVYDLLGGSLRAEFVGARDLTSNLGSGPARGVASARACYAAYVHPVGASYGVGARYDEFDPDTSDTLHPKGDGEQRTLGALVMRQIGDPVLLTLVWERPWLTAYDRVAKASTKSHHDLWTLQAQYRF
jgi:hypothetical protein